jgi:hypothetical protein
MSQGWTIPPEIDRELTPAVRAFLQAQRRQWEEERGVMQRRIEELEAKVTGLERQIKLQSKFGHVDPAQSVEPPTPPTLRQKSVKKKRGGQPGHPKAERKLVPVEQCREVLTCKPTTCRGCGESLTGDDPQPWRHQVTEIPEIKPYIIEYQRHRLICPCCQTSTCGELPEGVPQGMTGPRLMALAVLLMGVFRQSKRRVSLFCQLGFNVDVSTGLVIKWQKQATEATRVAYHELVDQLPLQPAVNVDETPTKEATANSWIWTVVTPLFTVFALRLTKARTVICQLLGEAYAGVVTSDRAKMYDCFKRHQWCWAHLKRDFEAIALKEHSEAKQLGEQLVALTNQVFHHWHRVRDGTVSYKTFQGHITRLQAEFHNVLDDGTRCADSATAALCTNLFNGFENLWVFANDKTLKIEPTNNSAERALRHPVIWKGLSFGTQSDSGSRFVETILTIAETCRQQDKNVLTFLYESLTNHFKNQPGPSLLPKGV